MRRRRYGMAARWARSLSGLLMLVVCITACRDDERIENDGQTDGAAASGGASSGGSRGSLGGTGAGGGAGDSSGGTGGDAGGAGSGGGAGGSFSGPNGGGAGSNTTGGNAGHSSGGGSGGGAGGTGTGGPCGDLDATDRIPEDLAFSGPIQVVDESTGEELQFGVPNGEENGGIGIVVLFAPPCSTDWTPAPVSSPRHGGWVEVVAVEPGTYAPAVVDTSPPADCDETVWEGSLTLSSDLDVAELEGYTHVAGDLVLDGTLTDVSPLRCLTEVIGDLVVTAPTLQAAEFPNLVQVQGAVSAYDAVALATFAAPRLRLAHAVGFTSLDELTAVYLGGLIYGGRVDLVDVGTVADEPLALDFASLVSVHTSVYLENAGMLEGLDGFSALRAATDVGLGFCTALENTNGLSRLESVETLWVENNTALTSLDLPALRSVGNAFVRDLAELTAVNASALASAARIEFANIGETASDPLELYLSSLRTIGRLDIDSVANLETLDALNALEGAGNGIWVRGSAALSDATLPALTQVANTLLFEDNANLQRISLPLLENIEPAVSLRVLPKLEVLELTSIQRVGGDFELDEVGAIADGDLTLLLDALRIVDGNLTLSRVTNLANLDGFSEVRLIGNIEITENATLADATGLSKLNSAGQGASIADNPQLKAISLASITQISDTMSPEFWLDLRNLPELTSLIVSRLESGGDVTLHSLGSSATSELTLDFTALTELRGDLAVQNNPALVSLAAFDQLVTLGGNLDVLDNTSLSECFALELVSRLEANGFDGLATIDGNMADTCD